MKYPQEDIANDLHCELTQRFSSTAFTVSIEGAGVHWHCTAAREIHNARFFASLRLAQRQSTSPISDVTGPTLPLPAQPHGTARLTQLLIGLTGVTSLNYMNGIPSLITINAPSRDFVMKL